MSVFESLKKGLKSFTSRDPSTEESSKYTKTSVNLDAGADLLHKYQVIWKELHENTENNAKLAEEVDVTINKLYVEYDRQNEVLGRIHGAVATLPLILNQLQSLTDVLGSLDDEYDKVEAALIQLENVCEEQELQTAKLVDSQKLAAYRNRKLDELDKMKVHLAKDHVKKIQKLEKKKQIELKERHDAFQDAFDQDIDYFRTHGRLDRVSVSSSESAKKADLGDITVEEDQDGLDDFLNTTEAPQSTETSTVSQSEDKLSEDEESPVVIKSSEELDLDEEYYEDDLGASHGDLESYLDSEDVTEESDVEKSVVKNIEKDSKEVEDGNPDS